MSPKVTKVLSVAALAACATLLATAPADARDWRLSVDRHYTATEQAKYTPKGDNPQWDFSLDTVVNDMAWRARTASMLRTLRKPGDTARNAAVVEAEATETDGEQLADRPEAPSLRFAF